MIPIKDNMPTDRPPVITLGLIVAILVVYLAAGHAGAWGSASIVQAIVDMWFLWLFGNSVEDSMGPARFLAFCTLGGLLALGVQALTGTHDPVVAGGAISAVVGGSIVLYPRGKVLSVSVIPLLFTVVEVPSPILAALWLAVQVVFAIVGWTAYVPFIAGFLFGMVAVRPLATRRKPTPPTQAAY
ncbi:MAG: rhomboid family intramembrane serine protease [Solirubrobacteraceae bacterium]